MAAEIVLVQDQNAASFMMKMQPTLDADDVVGDFEALMRQLDSPQDTVTLSGGYAGLLLSIVSSDFRQRSGYDRSVSGSATA